ncbi:unnamed protein product, partial [Meganyctiphanes norvegica]
MAPNNQDEDVEVDGEMEIKVDSQKENDMLHNDIQEYNEETNNNEDMFAHIGFGKWNILYLIGVCLSQASAPAQYLSSVFVNMPTNFTCANISESTNTSHLDFYYENSCTVQNILLSEELITDNKLGYISEHCKTFEYDTSVFKSTLTTEFDLVCDRKWLFSLYQIILVIGAIFGNLLTGVSDTFGRVSVMRVSGIFYAVGALLVGCCYDYYLILLGRFLLGMCHTLFTTAVYTIVMETLTPNMRSTIGIMMNLPYYICCALMGLIAYYIRHWRMLHLVLCIPVYPIPFIVIFMDKSPRWLVQNGHLEEAHVILEKAAKLNGGIAPSKEHLQKYILQKDSKVIIKKKNVFVDNITKIATRGKLLFGSKSMCRMSLITPLVWFFTSCVYFGVPLNANSFTDNPFLYISIVGLAEVPSCLFGSFFLKGIGNIKTVISMLLVPASSLLLVLVIPDTVIWIRWIFVVLAMMAIGLATNTCIVLTNEIFPTVVRTTGYGICVLAYYSGFLLSSYVNSILEDKVWWLFNVICSASCIMGAILAIQLPETQGKPLCENIEDVKRREADRLKNNSEYK